MGAKTSSRSTDDLREELRDNADIFEEAVRILRHGAETAERMWLNRALKVGKDLKQLAEDVVTFEKVETTGQRKAKTWGKDGSKEDKRRAQNTMGYHRRTPDEASRAQTSKP
ncbi:hypothetical protein NMY22_g10274 [Coprinellus aureogranulatus]|nr:hypothetical protein NMY22_g10274 [Coprinellus aureogranulatus]